MLSKYPTLHRESGIQYSSGSFFYQVDDRVLIYFRVQVNTAVRGDAGRIYLCITVRMARNRFRFIRKTQ
jgi:hypothetical protein